MSVRSVVLLCRKVLDTNSLSADTHVTLWDRPEDLTLLYLGLNLNLRAKKIKSTVCFQQICTIDREHIDILYNNYCYLALVFLFVCWLSYLNN